MNRIKAMYDNNPAVLVAVAFLFGIIFGLLFCGANKKTEIAPGSYNGNNITFNGDVVMKISKK